VKSAKPRVLVVDDEPDKQRGFGMSLGRLVAVEVLHPDEVEQSHLGAADLVLIDFRLEEWPKRDAQSAVALKPGTGLALAAVLRSHIRDSQDHPPTAFALRSSYLGDLSAPFPPESREHVIAGANNLEWAFTKQQPRTGPRLDDQVASLAGAVRRLPNSWPSDTPIRRHETVRELLALPGKSVWGAKAWQDIEGCHPPVHELSRRSHGLAFLRWLLHRIMPYPCFLLDTHRLASRLRVSPRSLRSNLGGGSGLRRVLGRLQYKGVLEDFLGARWWRAGVDSWLWQITGGNPFDVDEIHKALSSIGGAGLERSAVAEPVVCVDEKHVLLGTFSEADKAVRIQPDHWPVYAEQAWTTIELAREHSRLRAIVMAQDRERLRK